MKLKPLYVLLMCILALSGVSAQEDNPLLEYDVPSQNLLKFNRFLINPTFSTVREDKSYINLLHRNQSASFDDNDQMYFLSYSGRINDRTGLGLSLYTQRLVPLSNYGVLANYAYGVKLNEKSNFTFGANLSYYNSGYDESRANPQDINDPLLNGFQDNSLLTFQPGFNLSYGAFDFGMYAENLFDYNLKTSEQLTSFADKTFSGHLQYTHQFNNTSGVFEQGRLMPLARVRKVGEDELILGGNLILDLPKVGWLQGGYDSFYGASAGIGFNLNRRLSLGYTMEKGLTNAFDNFGVTHEISFAYSFTPNLTEDRVMLEEGYEENLVQNDETPEETLTETEKDKEIQELKRRLAENDAILAELIYRQDSIEQNQNKDLERRFEMVMRMVRRETQGDRPDIEEQAKQIYFINNDQSAVVSSDKEDPRKNSTVGVTTVPINTDNIDISDSQKVVERAEVPSRTEIAITEERKESVRDVITNPPTETADKVTHAVKQRRFRDLQDVADGYYIVANVYKGDLYLEKFKSQLNEQGLSAAHIENPNNGLKYVYLQRYDSWKEAEAAVKSQLNGAYSGQLWVMNVDNRYSNEAYASTAEKVREKSAKYESDVLQKNVVVRDNVTANEPREIDGEIGDGSGYYIIANVFASPKNANRFVKLLNTQGLSASYFINPKNNYRYVYLKRHNSWNSALISYYTKLNNAYDDKMWIMRVTPNLIT